MEAEKSHDVPSASWRPRQVCSVTQSRSISLRTRRADDINPSPEARENEMRCPSSTVRAFKGLEDAPHTGRATYLVESTDSKPNLFQNTLIDTPRNV